MWRCQLWNGAGLRLHLDYFIHSFCELEGAFVRESPGYTDPFLMGKHDQDGIVYMLYHGVREHSLCTGIIVKQGRSVCRADKNNARLCAIKVVGS